MNAARVIHFGVDECYRVAIMRGAGYAVEQCGTLMELRAVLKSGEAPHVICIAESYDRPREDALAMARAFSEAPVVLFRSTMHRYVCGTFDLEIDEVCAPEVWLMEMEALIAASANNHGKRGARGPGARAAMIRTSETRQRDMHEGVGTHHEEDRV